MRIVATKDEVFPNAHCLASYIEGLKGGTIVGCDCGYFTYVLDKERGKPSHCVECNRELLYGSWFEW